jgi:heat shock protein HslJ
MKTLSFFFLIIGLLAISMCSCKKNDSVPSALLKQWTLVSIQDNKTADIIPYPDSILKKETIQFTNDFTLVILGVCNGGNAEFFVKNDSLRIDNLAVSLKMCSNYLWELYLVNNLDSAYSYSLTSNQLIVYSKGKSNLIFKPF